MSVASEITRIKNNISSAYTALDGKGATLPLIQDSTNLANTIESIPAGGSTGAEQTLNLYDWEGTLLKSYTAAEAQALAALPNPSDCPTYSDVDHELLLFQKWNWSLTDIKTWLTNHSQGKLNIGAIYTTTDGENHNYWGNPRLNTTSTITIQKRAKTSIVNSECSGWYSLTHINIPDGVTSIGNSAFSYCYSLTHINIPDGVTSIGNYAFSECRSLTKINISDSVTSIGDYAFQYCNSLTQVNIPDGVTGIGNYAFSDCDSLTRINISDSVTSIGTSAFNSCRSLTQINIPDGVTGIENYAFMSCSSLMQISIPDSVTSIGNNTFSYCKNLCDVLLESKPALSNTNAFSNLPTNYRIYVPRANLSWFETATNWSTLYSRFVAIEDNIAYLESLGYNVDAYKENP